ncbi:MAG TPA: cyclic nucleotide-binding domain-containing protein [Gaiellales bacterium]
MQEELGRLMVGSALGVWDAPIGRREQQHEIEVVLEQVPLFSGLSKRHLGRVASVVAHRHCVAGETLVQAGTAGDAFYVVLDGEAAVDVPSGPIPLAAGTFFGEMAIIDGAPRSATVTAVSDMVLLVIARDRFLALLESEPTVALALLTTLAGRLRAAQA